MCVSVCFPVVFYFFFFNQKTAYEMRISDWSSDVCSSDLSFEYVASSTPYGSRFFLCVCDSDPPWYILGGRNSYRDRKRTGEFYDRTSFDHWILRDFCYSFANDDIHRF